MKYKGVILYLTRNNTSCIVLWLYVTGYVYLASSETGHYLKNNNLKECNIRTCVVVNYIIEHYCLVRVVRRQDFEEICRYGYNFSVTRLLDVRG